MKILLFTLAIVGIVVAGVFMFIDAPIENDGSRIALNDPRTEELKQFVKVDSDGDNLKDWEEALWGTDPKKADTDGDGTSDGVEVGAKRDPLISSPGDEIRVEGGGRTLDEIERDEKDLASLSTTDYFARDLFTNYVALRGSGNIGNASMEQEVFSDLFARSQARMNPPLINIKSIIIKNANSQEALRAYGDAIGNVISSHDIIFEFDELGTAKRAILTGEYELLEEVREAAQEYQAIVDELRVIPVPKDLAELHLEFTNNFIGLAYALETIGTFEEDSVAALFQIKVFQDTYNKMSLSAETIIDYLSAHTVTYESGESGSILNYL